MMKSVMTLPNRGIGLSSSPHPGLLLSHQRFQAFLLFSRFLTCLKHFFKSYIVVMFFKSLDGKKGLATSFLSRGCMLELHGNYLKILMPGWVPVIPLLWYYHSHFCLLPSSLCLIYFLSSCSSPVKKSISI